MRISECIKILEAEKTFERTPAGRPITERALLAIEATLQDTNNYDQPIFKCLNCCIMISGLLVERGCPLCGLKQKIKGE